MCGKGYINLYRKMKSWEWYQDTNTKSVFLHLILRANYATSRYMGQEVKRGQLLTTLPMLSNELGLSVQNVRTALKHLKLSGEMSMSVSRRGRMITVNNYDKYQGSPVVSQDTDDRPSTRLLEIRGYVKLFRSFLHWEWYKDQNTKAVFIHLLMEAAYCPTAHSGQAVVRGEYIFTVAKIAAELGLSAMNVRTALKHLKSTGEISISTTKKFSVAALLNYDTYQGEMPSLLLKGGIAREETDSDKKEVAKEKQERSENLTKWVTNNGSATNGLNKPSTGTDVLLSNSLPNRQLTGNQQPQSYKKISRSYVEGDNKAHAHEQIKHANQGKTSPAQTAENFQKSDVPAAKIVGMFNDICKSYPYITVLSGRSEAALAQTWARIPDMDIFKAAFEKCEQSQFLKGENRIGWAASFGWIVEYGNIAKILEGKYDRIWSKASSRPEHEQQKPSYDIEEYERYSINQILSLQN